MSPIASAAMSIAMIAAVLLGVVGAKQAFRKEDRQARQRGLLMLAMAIVLIGNVLIWTV